MFACIQEAAMAEAEATVTEGYKFVALARVTQAQWYVDHIKAEVAAEAASSCKVTSKNRKPAE